MKKSWKKFGTIMGEKDESANHDLLSRCAPTISGATAAADGSGRTEQTECRSRRPFLTARALHATAPAGHAGEAQHRGLADERETSASERAERLQITADRLYKSIAHACASRLTQTRRAQQRAHAGREQAANSATKPDSVTAVFGTSAAR